MVKIIAVYLPWLLSLLTVTMTVMQGNMNRNAWLLGLFNQALWLLWMVVTSAWGLIPLNLVLWYLYFKNYFKWRAR